RLASGNFDHGGGQEHGGKCAGAVCQAGCVVHTVGGFAGAPSVAETDDATFQRMFDVNLNSTFYLLRAVLPVMRKTRNGHIIAIGSRAALEPGAGGGVDSARTLTLR